MQSCAPLGPKALSQWLVPVFVLAAPQAYHPLCGRMAGVYMGVAEAGPSGRGAPRLLTLCTRHHKPLPRLAGAPAAAQLARSNAWHVG
jgi:hypothetical protein